MAQYEVGHQKRLEAVEERVRELPGFGEKTEEVILAGLTIAAARDDGGLSPGQERHGGAAAIPGSGRAARPW